MCVYENLYSPELNPVANNMREHREKLNPFTADPVKALTHHF